MDSLIIVTLQSYWNFVLCCIVYYSRANNSHIRTLSVSLKDARDVFWRRHSPVNSTVHGANGRHVRNLIIKTCEAGLVLSVTRILRPIPCVCVCVCMYAQKLPNHWTNLHKKLYQQIERFTVIAIGYLDLKYLLNTMNIVPNRRCCTDVLRQWQRIAWRHRRNQCYHWVFRNNPDWPTKKNPEKPRQYEINFNTIANLNKFELYTSTVLRSVLVNFSAVSGFQFINIQCPLSWMSF